MLVLGRREGESIFIGDDMELSVLKINLKEKKVRFGITASDGVELKIEADLYKVDGKIKAFTIYRRNSFNLGKDIEVVLVDVYPSQIRIGIDAPKSVKLVRNELSPK